MQFIEVDEVWQHSSLAAYLHLVLLSCSCTVFFAYNFFSNLSSKNIWFFSYWFIFTNSPTWKAMYIGVWADMWPCAALSSELHVAYPHHLPVQCTLFTFSTFLENIYIYLDILLWYVLLRLSFIVLICILQCGSRGLLSYFLLGLPPLMLYSFGPVIIILLFIFVLLYSSIILLTVKF
jgi:hypothetical protein